MTEPAGRTSPGLRVWWKGVTFGARNPVRRIAALGTLGVVSGFAETAVVLLLVAMVSPGQDLSVLIPSSGTWTLGALALSAVVVLAAMHLASAWIAANASAEAQSTIQMRLVDAFLGAPWALQRTTPPGELQELVSNKAVQAVTGTGEAARAVATAGNLVVVVVAAMLVDVRATAGLLAVVVFAVLVGRPMQLRRRRLALRAAVAATTLAHRVAETVTLASDVRIFGVRDRARAAFASVVDTSTRLARDIQLAAAVGPVLTRDATLGVLVIAVAIIVVAADVSLTVLGATVVLVLRALSHAQALSTTLHRLADRWANLKPITDRLEQWETTVARGRRRCQRIGTVEVRAVSFAHADGAPDALREASLVVGDGEQLGIIGPTGAGKSTLAAILLGLLRPRDGRVLVDGVALDEIDAADWHSRIAWVAQDPALFTGTVRENIRFLREEIADESIAGAAQAAALDRDIAGWSDGLDHHVGPAGAALSGGQRQRIALARALAGEPDLVVLDEPTSALDVHTEAAVRATLAALRGSASVVVIAHRLSTINLCDRVAVLRDGQLVAIGPPDELAQEDAYYREALALSAPGMTRA